MGRITIRKHWKCSQAICTVASATCNSHVLLRRERLIIEVVDGVAAETVLRPCRHRTWQGAVNVEQRVSVQMRSDAVVQASLGCEFEDAVERDDREHRAAVVEPANLSVRACVFDCMLGECPCDIEKFRPTALAYAMAALRLASSSEMRTAPGLDDDQHTGPCICS